MRNPGAFLAAAASLTAALVLAGCGGKDDGEKSSRAGPATAIGTPNPGFAGEAPKGAHKLEGIEVGKYGGTLVLSTPGNPKTFNPLLSNESSSNILLNGPMFSSCWGYNLKKQEDEPALCEKYERSEDGLTYTFTLREGLQWSDGKPITTDDVEFSYQVAIDPNIAAPVKDLFREVDPEGKEGFPRFEKVDARTFRFTLAQPNVLFHSNVGSLYLVPRHKWEAAYKAGNFNQVMRLNEKPDDVVVSGPYRLKQIATDERIVLERNPHFWRVDPEGNRLPYIDRVIFLVVPDFNAAFLQFQDGKTDIHDTRPEHYDALKRNEAKGDYVIESLGPGFSTNYVMFNLDTGTDKDGKPFVDPVKQRWFHDKRFRKAVSHAIDRDGIVRTVMAGRGEPLWTFYSPANEKWRPEKVVQYPYDLEKARAYLKEAGFEHRDGALYDAAGNKVEFSIMTNVENATRIGMINVIKDDLAKLGMTVHIRPVPFNDVVTSLRSARNFEGLLLGWGSAVPPDPAQSKNVMLSSGTSHHWHPNQPKPATEWEAKIDELLHKNTSTYDYAERKKYSDELLYIFSDEQPQIQLVVQHAFVAGRKNLGNFLPAAIRPDLVWYMDRLYFKTPKKQ